MQSGGGWRSREERDSQSSLLSLLSCSVMSNSFDPKDCSPPGSSVCGISQVRILERVAISFSRGSSWTQGLNWHLLHWQTDSLPLSHQGSPNKSFVIPWIVACQTPLAMGFPRQEYWSGLPFSSPTEQPALQQSLRQSRMQRKQKLYSFIGSDRGDDN